MPLQIRPLDFADIPSVVHFPPEDWNFDFKALLRSHLGHGYFHPVVGTLDGRPVAVGHGIRHGEVAWLGNIIVSAAHRGSGFGTALTAHLVEFMQAMGCRTQVLIATAMGEPVYRKLGFRVSSRYSFLKGPQAPRAGLAGVSLMEPKDHGAVLELDRRATGECRGSFLAPHLPAGLVYRTSPGGEVRGCFLPTLGSGAIIAADGKAGRVLLRMKAACAAGTLVVPDSNPEAKAQLEAWGMLEYASAPRMTLGPEPDWRPGMIWSRGAGYCG